MKKIIIWLAKVFDVNIERNLLVEGSVKVEGSLTFKGK
jgi:hypothetical protein